MFAWEIMFWLFKDTYHVLTVKGSSSSHVEIMSWLFKDPVVTVA